MIRAQIVCPFTLCSSGTPDERCEIHNGKCLTCGQVQCKCESPSALIERIVAKQCVDYCAMVIYKDGSLKSLRDLVRSALLEYEEARKK
jgi:hypothetical protein